MSIDTVGELNFDQCDRWMCTKLHACMQIVPILVCKYMTGTSLMQLPSNWIAQVVLGLKHD